jgi:hypothetical protein
MPQHNYLDKRYAATCTVHAGRDYLWAQKRIETCLCLPRKKKLKITKIIYKYKVFSAKIPKNDKFKLYFWKILKMKKKISFGDLAGKMLHFEISFNFIISNILDLFFRMKNINTFQSIFRDRIRK